MLDVNQISKLSTTIQEVLRITDSRKPLFYVDINNNLGSVISKTPHILFGRRGTGKSALISEAYAKLNQEGILSIKIDCENFKNHQFPDVITAVAEKILISIKDTWSFSDRIFHYRLHADLKKEIDECLKLTADPLTHNEELSSEISSSLGGQAGSIKGEVRATDTISSKYIRDKLSKILIRLPGWKNIIIKSLNRNKQDSYAVIFFDDFYHLPSQHQAQIADVIHRICKGSNVYFKIATIRHRTKLYIEENNQPIGVQARHDYQPLDLDFSLEKFEQTKNSLWSILTGISKTVQIDEDQLRTLFGGDGLNRLVLASGGVPRDFLSILVNYLNSSYPSSGKKVIKDVVRDFAGKIFADKKEDLKRDADSSEVDHLYSLFSKISAFCLEEKQKNIFQISKDSEEKKPDDYFRLLKLADFRLIHLISTSRSNPTHPGKVFDIYCLDLGTYAHIRKLSGKLDEIDLSLGKESIDKLRTAPIFEL